MENNLETTHIFGIFWLCNIKRNQRELRSVRNWAKVTAKGFHKSGVLVTTCDNNETNKKES